VLLGKYISKSGSLSRGNPSAAEKSWIFGKWMYIAFPPTCRCISRATRFCIRSNCSPCGAYLHDITLHSSLAEKRKARLWLRREGIETFYNAAANPAKCDLNRRDLKPFGPGIAELLRVPAFARGHRKSKRNQGPEGSDPRMEGRDFLAWPAMISSTSQRHGKPPRNKIICHFPTHKHCARFRASDTDKAERQEHEPPCRSEW